MPIIDGLHTMRPLGGHGVAVRLGRTDASVSTVSRYGCASSDQTAESHRQPGHRPTGSNRCQNRCQKHQGDHHMTCPRCHKSVSQSSRSDSKVCSGPCRQAMYRRRLKVNRPCSDPFDIHCLDGETVAADGYHDDTPVCWQCRRALQKQSPEVAAA